MKVKKNAITPFVTIFTKLPSGYIIYFLFIYFVIIINIYLFIVVYKQQITDRHARKTQQTVRKIYSHIHTPLVTLFFSFVIIIVLRSWH